MDLEKITIGIPCFNAETTIRRAIESALEQDWSNIEILIVDDRSTDQSPQIVRSIAHEDHRVRLIRHTTNTGVGGVRQTIVNEATGDFIVFFDDDDESHTSRLRIQRNRILEYEKQTGQSLIACYASGQRRYPNDYVIKLPAIGSQPEIPIGESVIDYLLFNERIPGVFYGAGPPTCALMARKTIIQEIGGFDIKFRRVEDTEFAIRLALKGGHFVGCAEELYTQFATTGGDKSAAANLDAELQLLEKNKAYLLSKKRYRYARCWFRFRYYHFSKKYARAILTLLSCWVGNPWLVTQHFFRSAPRRILHEIRMGNFGKK